MDFIGLIFLILEFNWMLVRGIFFFVPPLLVIFSLSMVILTITIWCRHKEKMQFKYILRFFLIIYLIITSLYALEIIQSTRNMNDATFFEMVIIIAGIVAPICIMIVGRYIMNLQIKGIKIFNPTVLWIIYLLVGIFWEIFFPGQVHLFFVIVFTIINIIILHYVLSKGGELEDE